MSDMKTFTVRELDRETAKVMEACDTYGSVRIKRRDGRTYTLRPETDGNFSMKDWLEERRQKRNELFPNPLSKKATKEFFRDLRGDRE